jgi:hypothetical protein
MRKEMRLVKVDTAINPAPIKIARFIASNIGFYLSFDGRVAHSRSLIGGTTSTRNSREDPMRD